TATNPAVKGTETAALVSLNPATGEIVAYDGGNDKNQTQLDMASTLHQAGSSFKPYVLAAGVENMPDKIGLNSVYDPTSGHQVDGGISIGQYEIRPIDQAQGYATFANNGMYVPAHFVRQVTDNTGVMLYKFNATPTPAFGSDPNTSGQIAHTVADAMSDVAKSSQFGLAKNRPADAKTGT